MNRYFCGRSFNIYNTLTLLQVFHNVILEYCSKRHGYKHDAFVTRHQLAYLDHNNHLDREQLKRKNGTLAFARRWGKRTKQWHVVKVPVPKSFPHVSGMQV